ncbi:MAG: ARMT1-like domain-containing protein [Candidatus Caldatribacterium sp.]|uniref:damage-control phosphatase ARMT1 family protein n=1 Tax=Candidatus Caldatribacterium sp. TaxID=2282143 RepID=UPI002991FB06|nr:ARMT1-like domain-containing protein [Candidatus Caldatribacterium sp.]MCX7730905.1 ARMT1-like domain-containing protein [Candidatus Caldatribacterium sp.]MDW8080831.1 ARMT1-like domain-containing protein [Candidatus Calescibacterium sp.]
MKAQLECFTCNIRQAQEAAEIAGGDFDCIWKVSQRVCALYAHADPQWTPAYMTTLAHQIAKEITGVEDIYYRFKRHYNRMALELYSQLKAFVASSENSRLERAVLVAIAGNVIDLGVYRDVNASDILAQVTSAQWGKYDFPAFFTDLLKARTIVYVGDNAGEVVFDRVLIEEIQSLGKKEIVFVVKGGPISNDALLEDAKEAGLDELTVLMTTGQAETGIDVAKAPRELQEIWKKADLIISKGQGNFETLSGRKENIYFLLKAKCVPVAREFGVPQGALILKRNLG